MRTALNNLNADLVAQASSPASSGGVPPPGPTPVGTTGQPAAGTPALHGYPDYVCRVTADEGDIGRGHMQRFQDVETRTPTILTTSQLLSTGLDAPMCRNVVLVRLVNSMVEFKQIIGRGTRVRDDYGKLWFNILDYTGTATRSFADRAFDADPAFATEAEIDEYAQATHLETETPEEREDNQG